MPNRSGEKRTRIKGQWLRAYEGKVALSICEQVAQGFTLNEICLDPEQGGVRKGLVHPNTFHRWCQVIPALADAYAQARKISAIALEEEALDAARDIRADPGSGTKVRAYEVSMGQLRWSASRRDPKSFGQQAGINVQVPIQINTNLDMAPGASGISTEEYPDVYTIEAQVVEPFAESDAENMAASSQQASEPGEDPASAPTSALEPLRGLEVFDENTQVEIPLRDNKRQPKPKRKKRASNRNSTRERSSRGDWSRRAASRRKRSNGGIDPLRLPGPSGKGTGAEEHPRSGDGDQHGADDKASSGAGPDT